jgi:hypothetical protein
MILLQSPECRPFRRHGDYHLPVQSACRPTAFRGDPPTALAIAQTKPMCLAPPSTDIIPYQLDAFPSECYVSIPVLMAMPAYIERRNLAGYAGSGMDRYLSILIGAFENEIHSKAAKIGRYVGHRISKRMDVHSESGWIGTATTLPLGIRQLFLVRTGCGIMYGFDDAVALL